MGKVAILMKWLGIALVIPFFSVLIGGIIIAFQNDPLTTGLAFGGACVVAGLFAGIAILIRSKS